MQTWKWLYNPQSPYHWRFLRNVLFKTALLFVALNLLFAAADPLSVLGHVSAYNRLDVFNEAPEELKN